MSHIIRRWSAFWAASLVVLLLAARLPADEAETPSVQRGYHLLLEKAYVPPYFDEETFDNVWQVWPEPLRSEAESGSRNERREMAFQRYGLTRRPESSGDPDNWLPLQFVVDKRGNWTPNCFTCHGGSLLGEPAPGRPNAEYALQTLIQETRLTKLRLGKKMETIDLGALVMPLGTTVGTTNAVIFGVALAAHRDADLNVVPNHSIPKYLHHDMDAPPWWHFAKRDRIYLDGFATKGHRPLMQFALDRVNGPERFHEWEEDFRHIYAYMSSLTAPEYPFSIDRKRAERGARVFERVCAECHGSYGDDESYPHRIVPIETIGTDRARFDALTDRHRQDYAENWFSHYGKDEVTISPGGYMAPPLDGIWASAPYLHNGSVPTLWHLLHADERPVVWVRQDRSYDQERVGFTVEQLDQIPKVRHSANPRQYFDTRKFGKSAGGHRFPEQLTEAEKDAVLEYLKTL